MKGDAMNGGEKRLITISVVLSVALLFILASSIPGLTFSLSSSVTSYNNTITVIGQQVTTSDGFNTISTSIDNHPAVEIVANDTEDKSFVGTGALGSNNAEVTVYANKIAVYLQFDGNAGVSEITVTVNTTSSNPNQYGPATFFKNPFNPSPSKGFLQISGNTAELVDTDYTEFETVDGIIEVKVTCATVYYPIHVFIVILS